MKKDDIIAIQKEEDYITAHVNWVVDDEAGITYMSPDVYKGSQNVIKISEGWEVIVESAPSYQSSVASLTDEELRESIDSLRRTRVTVPKTTRGAKREPVSNDPMAQALAKMDPIKKAELMRKLGMVD